MGISHILQRFNAPHRNQLGWIDVRNILTTNNLTQVGYIDLVSSSLPNVEHLNNTVLIKIRNINFDGDYYIDVTRAVKAAAPDIHVHGFTALEVTEGAKRLGESLASYLTRLKEAGLSSLPGTAAEILDDEVRAVLCSDKVNTEEWLDAHRTAHSVGLRSNVTMMFGSVEAPHAWARHIARTRALQYETGGFTEFVGLPFVHMASPIYLQRKSRRGPTFRETVLVHAIARLAYRGVIDNIQASWVKIGVAGTRQLLQAGCNDIGGTLMNENISRAAGASHGQGMTPTDFADLTAPLGRPLRQRTTLYAAR